MKPKEKKNYKKHQFTQLSEINSQISSEPTNIERKTMNKSMMKIISLLNAYEISIFPDFCQIFKTAKINGKDVANFLIDLLDYLEIDYIRLRLVKKSNSSERNMIFALICAQYSDKLKEFFINYISTNKIKPKSIIDFQGEFYNKIEQINQQLLKKDTIKNSCSIPYYENYNLEIYKELPCQQNNLEIYKELPCQQNNAEIYKELPCQQNNVEIYKELSYVEDEADGYFCIHSDDDNMIDESEIGLFL